MNYITASSSQTVYLKLEGYFFDRVENVILSASVSSFLPSLCSYSFLTLNTKLSGTFLPVSGYALETKDFFNQNENGLTVVLSGLILSGIYDLIFANQAGYVKLSDNNFLIEAVSASSIPGNAIFTFSNDPLLTFENDYITTFS